MNKIKYLGLTEKPPDWLASRLKASWKHPSTLTPTTPVDWTIEVYARVWFLLAAKQRNRRWLISFDGLKHYITI